MVDINAFWLMVLYVLGSILLVTLIILVVKLISTVNKVNSVLDDAESKLTKLNNLFDVVDTITDSLATISDKIVDGISNGLKKIFSKKRKGDETQYYEE